MAINFLKYKKIYYIFSGVLAISSLVFLLAFGLKFGIDFLGGSILEVSFEKRPENQIIEAKLKDLNYPSAAQGEEERMLFDLGEVVLQPTGENEVILRLKDISEETHQQIISRLGEISKIEEKRFESIGPTIGRELRQKTLTLVATSLVALLIYIAVSFRKVNFPVSSWQYGVISILTLSFDVLITVGSLALLGKFYNVQLSIPIITALLTILGYTINDKVIVFDRVRENLLRDRGDNFEDLVNHSLNETLGRSLSTGTCALLVLFFIFLLGGETLKYFALTLIIGILAGTYSSLFLAAPILVSWLKRKERKR